MMETSTLREPSPTFWGLIRVVIVALSGNSFIRVLFPSLEVSRYHGDSILLTRIVLVTWVTSMNTP